MIYETLVSRFSNIREMKVLPIQSRLSQVADLACTMKRIARRLDETGMLAKSESYFFGGEKNKPEKLRKIHGKADVVVFHYNPTEGDARMAVVRQLDPELVIYGHHHRSNHREHFEKKPDRFLKMNVSTWVESGYGYYLVDYTRGGAITADWKDGR